MLSFGVSGMLYFFFDAAQYKDRVAAHKRVAEREGLDVIKIPLKDFKLLVGDDELWYGGRMYDVSCYTTVNDTVCVSVFHDRDEERLVKSISDSFEPNDKCISDNNVHIVKYKVHFPDDGKILTSRFTLKRVMTPKSSGHLPHLLSHSAPVYTSVIKPPPRSV